MASSSKLGASSHGEEEVSQQVRLDLQSPSLEAWTELKLGGEQGLKAAIYYTVTKIVQEEEIKTGTTCSVCVLHPCKGP